MSVTGTARDNASLLRTLDLLRQAGELAYPWAVAVTPERRLFVVDAGNNRIQVWQL